MLANNVPISLIEWSKMYENVTGNAKEVLHKRILPKTLAICDFYVPEGNQLKSAKRQPFFQH